MDGQARWPQGLVDYFIEQGYVVYVIDQPMFGRSAAHPAGGPTVMFTAKANEDQFTAFEHYGTCRITS